MKIKLQRCLHKLDNWEDALREVLYRFRLPLFVLIVTVLAFYARTLFWPFVSGDYIEFLYGWLNDIRSLHGLHSIGTQIGNYTAPYHYLLAIFTYIPGLDNLQVIKITSTIADFFMATSLGLVAYALCKQKWKAVCAYAVVLCLPTVFLNSSAWGQCDAMYAAIVLFAIYLWLIDKKAACFFVYGLALAVKLQAIFFLPALVVFWLCGQARLRHFLGLAGGYVVAFLPAIIASGSLSCLTAAYKMQTVVHTLAPNSYTAMEFFDGFDQEDVYLYTNALVIFALIGIGIVAFYCWQKRAAFNQQAAFYLIMVMLCLVPYLMPGMRERYFYLAEVLAVVYALYNPRRIVVPLLLQLGTLPSYMHYLRAAVNPFGSWLTLALALPAIIAVWDLYKQLSANANAAAKLQI